MGFKVLIRPGRLEDQDHVAAVQKACPESAQWCVAGSDFFVAEERAPGGIQILGFIVWRQLGPGECEILNLAVRPEWRRKGVGRQLIRAVPGTEIFLEVRESNQAARGLYQTAGFREVGVRENYYQDPPERGIVMKMYSC